MDQSQLTWIANFIWGIADDVLRDLYVRGRHRDVILPMTVLRRLDAVLEPSRRVLDHGVPTPTNPPIPCFGSVCMMGKRD